MSPTPGEPSGSPGQRYGKQRRGRFAVPEYPKVLAAKRGRPRKDPREQHGPDYKIIELTQRHCRNGKFYGPGSVRVNDALAQDLSHAEDLIREQTWRYFNPMDRVIEISYGPRGNHVRVRPVANLDVAMADIMAGHAAPGLSQNGRIA